MEQSPNQTGAFAPHRRWAEWVCVVGLIALLAACASGLGKKQVFRDSFSKKSLPHEKVSKVTVQRTAVAAGDVSREENSDWNNESRWQEREGRFSAVNPINNPASVNSIKGLEIEDAVVRVHVHQGADGGIIVRARDPVGGYSGYRECLFFVVRPQHGDFYWHETLEAGRPPALNMQSLPVRLGEDFEIELVIKGAQATGRIIQNGQCVASSQFQTKLRGPGRVALFDHDMIHRKQSFSEIVVEKP
ncbi:MAG: hypothetical protein SFY92_06015 [Verrucomicrobiae bacterium]|nr:hypothetical protein [Verrucomicrobiae bacterium]